MSGAAAHIPFVTIAYERALSYIFATRSVLFLEGTTRAIRSLPVFHRFVQYFHNILTYMHSDKLFVVSASRAYPVAQEYEHQL